MTALTLRLSLRPFLLVALLFAALLLALAPSSSASAQTSTTLVSTKDQPHNSDWNLGQYDVAQRFITGSNTGGYILTSVAIELSSVTVGSAPYAVSIYTESGNQPVQLVAALTSPATVAWGTNTWTTSGIYLAPNTSYFVLIDSGSTADNRISLTPSGDEDSGGAAGWSVHNGQHRRGRSATTGRWDVFSGNTRLQINGYAANGLAAFPPTTPQVNSNPDSPTTLTLSWRAPDASAVNLPIQSYDVRYRDTSRTAWDDGPQDRTATSATITGLTEGTIYEVQVRATSSGGDSDWSASGYGVAGGQALAYMVSNTTQANEFVDNGNLSTHDIFQPFTTGTDATSYRVAAVDLLFFTVAAGGETTVPDVRIFTDLNGRPNLPVGESFTKPARLVAGNYGLNTWTSPGVVLQPGTTYHLGVLGFGTAAHIVRNSSVTNEDGGGMSGWSVGDSHNRRVRSGGAYSAVSKSLKMRLSGDATIDPNAPGTLVSNTGEGDHGTWSLGDNAFAQGFTTGSNAHGYTLTGAGFRFGYVADAATEYSVSIYTAFNDNSSRPITNRLVGTLTSPAALVGYTVNTWTTPGIYLASSTSYVVVIEGSTREGNLIAHIGRNTEDEGAAAGWTIADDSFRRPWYLSAGAFPTFHANELLIQLDGFARANPTNPPTTPIVDPDPDNPTTLPLSWRAPDATAVNLPTQSYDVRYRVTGSATWNDGPQNQTATSATITGLTEGSAYEVQVRATSSGGDSDWSASGYGTAGGQALAYMVSTTGQANEFVDNGNLATHDIFQPFTTGTDATSYRVAAVELMFLTVAAGGETMVPNVGIYIDAGSGQPGARVGELLTKPARLVAGNDGLNTWTSPGVVLSPGTTYVLGIHSTGIAHLVRNTPSASEDGGGMAGWTLSDSHSRRPRGGASYSAVSKSLKMRFSGDATIDPLAPRAAVTLVTNIGKGLVTTRGLNTNDIAQSFRTGANTHGYMLTEVGLRYGSIGNGTFSYNVGIYTSSDGTPNRQVTALNPPGSLSPNSLNTWTTPALHLAPETDYFVLIDSGSNSQADQLQLTGQDGEDAGGLPGWRIGEQSRRRVHGSTNWIPVLDSVKLQLSGYALGSSAPSPPTTPLVNSNPDSPTTLSLSWRAPDSLHTVTSYDVRYRDTGSATWDNGPQDHTTTSATVTGLTDGTSYEVQVRATSSGGDSGWSASGYGTAGGFAWGGLVGNTSQANDLVDNGNLSTHHIYQPFTTGPSPEGYWVTGFELMFLQTSELARSSVPQVRIYEDMGDGTPGPAVGSPFTAPARLQAGRRGLTTWTSPGIKLEPSKTYLLAVIGAGAAHIVLNTASSALDSADYPGWSLNFGHKRRARGTTTFSQVDKAMKMRMFGYPEPGNAPVFAAASYSRSFIETPAGSLSAGVALGSAITATDPDDNTLTYSLSGTGADNFAIDSSTGQVSTKAGVAYDYEEQASYELTISAADGIHTATAALIITVTDVNETPVMSGKTEVNYAENGADAVATYTAADPENATITWSLSGTDAADFTISGGALTFTSPPDYEEPADSDANNVYHVTVQASDGVNTGTLGVTVTVTDVYSGAPLRPASPTVNMASSTSLNVSWAAPDNPDRPAITDYDVRYRATTGGDWDDHAHTGTGTTTVIDSLSSSTSYQVQVRAVNADGASPWSVPGLGNTAAAAVTLVSTVSQGNANSFHLGSRDVLQQFTTGTETSGYRVTSVQIQFETVASGRESDVPVVSIYTVSDSGGTGSQVGQALTGPASLSSGNSGLNTWTSRRGIDLEPGTTYWLIVEGSSDAGHLVRNTTARREDDGGLAGWSVRNQQVQRVTNPARSFRVFATLKMSLSGKIRSARNTLVSATGQEDSTSTTNLGDYDIQQQFTTGPNVAGYVVTEVAIELGTVASSAATQVPTVRIRTAPDETDITGIPVGDSMVGPDSLTANSTATFASDSGVGLAANTTYIVLVDSSASGERQVKLTASDDEDAGAAAGWSLGDTHRRSNITNPSGSSTDSHTVRLAIRGYANLAGVTVSETALTVDEADDPGTSNREEHKTTYTVVLDTDPGNGTTVTVTPSSSDTNIATVSGGLTFTGGSSGNWSAPQTVTVTGVADLVDNPNNARTAEITHTVSGYGSITTASSVTVTVRDDDEPAINTGPCTNVRIIPPVANAHAMGLHNYCYAPRVPGDESLWIPENRAISERSLIRRVRRSESHDLMQGKAVSNAVVSVNIIDTDAYFDEGQNYHANVKAIEVTGVEFGTLNLGADGAVGGGDDVFTPGTNDSAAPGDEVALRVTVSYSPHNYPIVSVGVPIDFRVKDHEGNLSRSVLSLPRADGDGPASDNTRRITVPNQDYDTTEVEVFYHRLDTTGAAEGSYFLNVRASYNGFSALDVNGATRNFPTASSEVYRAPLVLSDTPLTSLRLLLSRDYIYEDNGATEVTAAVVLASASDAATTVTVTIPDDSGYTASPSSFEITIPAGQTSGTAEFAFTPKNNSDREGDRTVTVTGTGTGISVSADLTIRDDEVPYVVWEGTLTAAARPGQTDRYGYSLNTPGVPDFGELDDNSFELFGTVYTITRLETATLTTMNGVLYRTNYRIAVDGLRSAPGTYSMCVEGRSHDISDSVGHIVKTSFEGTYDQLSNFTPGQTVDLKIVNGSSCFAAMSTVTVSPAPGSTTSLNVTWPSVQGATGYKVEYKTSGVPYSAVTRSDATATSETITGLTAGTEYTVRVTALHTVDGATVDGGSDEDTETTFTVFSSPSADPAAESATSLAVSWSAYRYASRYKVQWKTGGGSFNDPGITTTDTSYTITDLTPGALYTVKVTAQRLVAGQTQDLMSGETTGRTNPDLAGLTVLPVAGDATKLKASWDAAAGASGYQVSWKLARDAGATYGAPEDAAGTSHTITGLAADSEYLVRVTVRHGTSPDIVSGASAVRLTRTVPTPVTGLSALPVSLDGSRLDVSWDALAAATDGYRIEWKPIDAGNFTRGADVGAGTTTYQITGLMPAAPYVVKVRYPIRSDPVARYGESIEEEATTYPSPGILVFGVADDDEALDVEWQPFLDARGYLVEWKDHLSEDYHDSEEYGESVRTARIFGEDIDGEEFGLSGQSLYTVRVTALDGAGAALTQGALVAHGSPDDTAVTGLEIAAIADDSSALNVSWDAQAHTHGYLVQWKTGDEGYGDPVAVSTTSHKITGLQADTVYSVRVLAQFVFRGALLNTAPAETTGSTSSPDNNAPEFAQDSYSLSLDENTAGGTAVGAAITATDDDDDDLTYSLEGAAASSFEVNDAGQISTGSGATFDYETKNSYTVIIKAADVSASGTATVNITIKDVDEPTEAPAAPTVEAASTTSLSVTWTAPANTGPAISDYDVQYREGYSGPWISWDHSGSGTTTTITGLTAGTSYQVQVRAKNAEGDSDWSASGALPPSFASETVADQTYAQYVQITPLTLPAATGGDGTLNYALTGPGGGALPDGLSFNANTRVLSGMPTAPRSATTYTYTVTDGGGDTATLTFTISISPLVSNLGQADSSVAHLSSDYGQSFRTGGNTGGYTLTAVELSVSGVGTATVSDFSVSIYDSQNNSEGITVPGNNLVGSLTAPDALAVGLNTFTHAGLNLAANTDYYLVIDVAPGVQSPYGTLNFTSSGSEDAGGAAGWSIGDDYRYRDRGSTDAWSSIANFAAKIRIQGKPGSVPSFGAETVSDQSYTQNVQITPLTLPAATGGDGTLRYTLTGPGGGALPDGLSFNANTRVLSGTPTAPQTTATYTYTVTDGEDDTATLTFTITISALVSSMGQSDSAIAFLSSDLGQSFRTGGNFGGYTLTAVELSVFGVGTATVSDLSVSIYDSQNNSEGITVPGNNLVGTLTAPDALAVGLNTFTHAGLNLAANTEYYLVIDVAPGVQSPYATLRFTRSGSEDAGSAAGWSIGDDFRYRDRGSTGAWLRDANSAAKIRIQGRPGSSQDSIEVTAWPVAGSTTSLGVTWTKVTGAAGYVVQWKTGGEEYSVSARRVDKSGVDTTSHTITGLTAGTEYTIRVSAYSAGNSADPDGFSDEDTETTFAALSGLSASPVAESTSKLAVSWSAYRYASKYKVQWKTGDGSFNDPGVTTTDTSYTITDLTPGALYTVKVTAQRLVTGQTQDLMSGETDGSTYPDLTGLTVLPVAGDATELEASWDAAAGASGYQVSWKLARDAGATYGAPEDVTGTRHKMRGLTADTEYLVRVTVRHGISPDIVSGASAVRLARTVPTPVTGLSVLPVSLDGSRLDVSWDAFAATTGGYRVEWRPRGSVGGAGGADVGAGTTTYQITGLMPATPYVVKVRYPIGSGPMTRYGESIEEEATTYSPPGILVFGVANDDEALDVEWKPFADARGYLVEWKDHLTADYNDSEEFGESIRTARITEEDIDGEEFGLSDQSVYTVRVTALDDAGDALTINPRVAHGSPDDTSVTGLAVVAVEGSATELAISWDAQANTHGYLVQWKTGDDAYGDPVAVSTASHKITGLRRDTGYTVRVLAQFVFRGALLNTAPAEATGTTNAEGNSVPVFGAASYSFTLVENAVGSTTAVSVGTVSATDADTGDTATYSITAGNTGGVFAIDGSTGEITYTGGGEDFEGFVTPASAFSLTVQASDGTASATVTVTVGVTDVDTEAPGAPAAPTVEAASTTSLSVSWSAPANTGPAISDYDVQYRKGASGDWTAHDHTGTATTTTITGLEASQSYQVQVKAKNAEGDSPWSASGAGSTNGPDDVSELSFGSATVADQSYTQNTQITPLTLPEATGGDGALTYSLIGPDGEALPAGLSFNASTRVLSGTPTGTQECKTYIYQVTDEAAEPDSDALTFAITVTAAGADLAPSFCGRSVADQIYTQDTQILELTLPEAVGGDGTLNYSLTPTPPTGLTFDPATRVLSGTPTAAQEATTYTYKVTDGDNTSPDSDTLTFGITVVSSGSDRTPTFGTQTVPDQTYTQNVTVDVTLPVGGGGDGSLSYDLTPQLPSGLSFDGTTRKITGTPTGTQAAATYTYKVTDSDATDPDSDTLTFSIAVVAEGTPVSVSLVSNTAQADLGTTSLGSYDVAQGFTTGDASDGYRLTGVDIDFGAVGDAAAAYGVSIYSADGEGSPGTLVGTALTGPSSLAADSLNSFTSGSGVVLDSGTTYFVHIDSSGAASNEISTTLSNFEDAGSLAGWSISDDGLSRNRDGSGAWSESTSAYKIRVKGYAVPSAPVFDPDSVTRTISEDIAAGPQRVGAPVTATDPNGDTLSYTIAGDDAADFSIVSGTGQIWTWIGVTFDYETKSSYSVTVTAWDDDGHTDTATVTIDIDDVNETPVVSGDAAVSYAENGTGEIATYTAADPERATIAWSLAGTDAADFEISNGGVLSFAATPDYESPADADTDNVYSVTVQASDGTNTGSLDVTVTVTDVDEAPVVSGNAVVSYAENGTDDVSTYTAADPENATITWSLSGTDAADFAISSGGVLSFSATPDYENPADADTDNVYSVTVRATDGTNTGSLAVTVTVTDVNETPVVSGDATVSYAENGTDDVATYTAADPESATIAWSLAGTDAADFAISSGGALSFSATPDYEGPADADTDNVYSVTVQASDGTNTGSLAVTVTVTDVDTEAPTAPAAPTVDGASTTSLSVSWSAPANTGPAISDYDVQYRKGTSGDWTAHDHTGTATTTTITGLEASQSYQVQVKAKNAEGDSPWSASGAGSTNAPANRAPAFGAASYSFTLAENAVGSTTAVSVGTVSATDADTGDTVTYSITAGNTGSVFAIDGSTGEITYTGGGEDYEGFVTPASAFSLTVQASDGTASATVTVTVGVTDVNEAPVVSGDAAVSYAENGTGDIATYTAADPESVTITWSLAGTDAADFSISGGVLSFSATPDYESPADADTDNVYSVTVQALDGTNSGTLAVTVTVTDVNETPVVSGDAAVSYAENGTGDVATYTAADPENATITWSLAGTDAADFSISGGALSFSATPNYESPADSNTDNVYSVTVQASDGTNTGALEVTVTVTDVNETPTVSGDAAVSYAENGTGNVATYTAADPENATIIWSLAGTDAADFVISNGGALSFSVTPDYEGPADSNTDNVYSVTVQASDGANSGSLAVTVTVTDVDTEAPGAPAAPTVRAASTTSLSVSWSAPANTGPAISDYDVQYRKGTSGDWTAHDHTGTGTSTTIGSLEASQSYQVQVKAKNAEGDSPWSARGAGSTSAVTPASKVTGVAVDAEKIAEQVKVSWGRSSGATGYKVQWKTSNQDWDATGRQRVISDGATLTVIITGLTGGAEYSFRVIAVKTGVADAAPSDVVKITTLLAGPAAPTNVAATPAGSGLLVTWTPSSSSDVRGYNIWWGVNSARENRRYRENASFRKQFIENLTAGTEYKVLVSSYKHTGPTQISTTGQGFSEEVTGTPLATAAGSVKVNSVTSTAAAQITVTWNEVPGADGYKIYYSKLDFSRTYPWLFQTHGPKVVSGGDTTTANLTSDDGIEGGESYDVWVLATKSGAAHSDLRPHQYDLPDTSRQVAVLSETLTKLRVRPVTRAAEKLHVTWGQVAGATSYVVQWKTGGGSYNSTDRANPTGTSYTIGGLDGDTTYHVKVTVIKNGTVDSPDGSSAESSGTTYSQLTGLSVVGAPCCDDALRATWDNLPGNDGYTVHWKVTDGGQYSESDRITKEKNVTTADISALQRGTEYTVRVTAWHRPPGGSIYTRYEGDSIEATESTHTKISGITVAPVPGSTSELRVSWNADTRAEGYDIFWSTSQNYGYGDCDPTNVNNTACTNTDGAGSGTSHVIDDLEPATAYYVLIRPRIVDFQGGQSDADGVALGAPVKTYGPLEDLSVAPVSGQPKRLAVSWSAVSDATGYVVQWKQATHGVYGYKDTHAITGSPPATSYTITQLEPSTAYDVKVTAIVHGSADSPDGDSDEAQGTTGTVAALEVKAHPTEYSALLVYWNPSTEPGVTGHLIQWKGTGQEYSTTERSHTAGPRQSSYRIALPDVGTYTVRVTQQGGASDGTSDEVTVTVHGWFDVYVDPSPGSANAVHVEWEEVSNAAGFVIWWRLDDGSAFNDTDKTSIAVGNLKYHTYGGEKRFPYHEVTGLQPDTRYRARVTAYTAAGSATSPDGLSQEGRGATHSEVTGLTVSPVDGSTTELAVSWGLGTSVNAPEVTGYVVQWKTGTDEYGDTDRAEVTSGTSHRITGLTANTGYSVRVTAQANYYGSKEDGDSAEGTATTNAATSNPSVNRAPVFGADSYSRSFDENTAAGTAVGAAVAATDADNDSLTYTLGGTDANSFTISASTGQISTNSGVTYDHESKSSYTVTVTASDGTASDSATVNISVNDVNETPTVSGSAAVSYAENATGDVATYTAVDPESATIAWSLAGTDAADFAISNGGALSFVATPDYESPADSDTDNVYSVTVQASDGTNTGSLAVTVTVTDVDTEAPSAPAAPTVEAASTTTLSVSWSAPTNAGPAINDYDVQYRKGTSGDWTAHDHTGTGTSTTIGSLEANQSYQVQVKAKNAEGDSPWSDSGAGSTNAPANRAPAFGADSYSRSFDENTAAGTAVGAAVAATDADGDSLTYTLGGTDANSFTINASTGQISTKSGVAYDHESKSSYTVTVTASDGTASDSATVNISVNDVNETPTVSGSAAVSYAENGTGSVATYTAADPENGTITWSLAGTDSGNFSISDGGVLSFVATPDYENPADSDTDNVYSVTVQASDGTNTGSRAVTVTVTDVQETAPTPSPGGLSGSVENAAVVLTWTPGSDSSITGQRVMRRVRGQDFVVVAELGVGAATYTDNTVVSGTRYFYRIESRSDSKALGVSNRIRIDVP